MRYLVRQKGYIAEEDIQKRLENLEYIMNLVKKFEKKIGEEKIKRVQMRKEKRKERKSN